MHQLPPRSLIPMRVPLGSKSLSLQTHHFTPGSSILPQEPAPITSTSQHLTAAGSNCSYLHSPSHQRPVPFFLPKPLLWSQYLLRSQQRWNIQQLQLVSPKHMQIDLFEKACILAKFRCFVMQMEKRHIPGIKSLILFQPDFKCFKGEEYYWSSPVKVVRTFKTCKNTFLLCQIFKISQKHFNWNFTHVEIK